MSARGEGEGEETRRRRMSEAEKFKEKFNSGEHIDLDVELTEEILKKLGIHPTLSKGVFDKLWSNNTRTWRNLLDLESREDAVEATGGDKRSGTAIWNAVKEYNKRAARGSVDRSQVRDPLLIYPELGDVSKFFREQLIEESSEKTDTLSKRLKRSAPDRDEFVLKLATDISRAPYNQDELVVRAEIQKVINQILDFFENRSIKRRARLLIGSRGCGKTTVGKIIAVLLACNGHVVLYRMEGLEVVLFPKVVSPETQASLQKVFGENMPNLEANDERVFQFRPKLNAHEAIVARLRDLVPFIYDIGDEADAHVGMMHGENKWLLISSPNAGKWRKFLTQSVDFYEYIVLPTWSWNQVKRLKRDPSLPLQEVRDRFQRFGGGSLRHLLSLRYNVDPLQLQRTQWRSVERNILKEIVAGQFENLPFEVEKNGFQKTNLDLVYRIEACPGRSPAYKVVLASNFVIHFLVVEYLLVQRMDANVLFETVSSCPQAGAFARRICEAVFHRCISATFDDGRQQLFDFYHLQDDRRVELRKGSEFRVGDIEIFTSTDFQNLQLDKLYVPMIPNFKGIDSFSIVPRRFIEKYFPDHPGLKNAQAMYFIVFFQATVSSEHVVDGPWLLELVDKISSAFAAKTNSSSAAPLPFALAFLTVEDGIPKHQVVTQSSKPKVATVKAILSELERLTVPLGKGLKKAQLIQKLEEAYKASASEGPRLLLKSPPVEPGKEPPRRQACPNQASFGPQYAVVLRSGAVSILGTLKDKMNGREEPLDEDEDEEETEEDLT